MKCARCGKPATKRLGIDLVEPDSGVGSCDACSEVVALSLYAAISGDEDIARDLMEMPARAPVEEE